MFLAKEEIDDLMYRAMYSGLGPDLEILIHGLARRDPRIGGCTARVVTSASDEAGSTMLHYAARRGQHENLDRILTHTRQDDLHTVYVNQQNRDGDTALHIAASRGWTYFVDVLMTENADPEIHNRAGKTALHLADESGYEDTCVLLAKYGVKIRDRKRAAGSARQEEKKDQQDGS